MRIVSIVGVLVGLAFIGWAEMRPHPPLLLRGEAELWGVAKGRGTAAEPYVIENLRIDAAGEPFGLLLENIGRPLILRNLEIYGASVAALRLHNVHLVRVENVILRGSATGLLLHRGEKVVVQNAVIVECADGVRAMFSRALEFAGLRVTKCATGLWFQGVQDSTLTDSEIAACGVGLLLELGSGNNLIVGNAFRYNHVHARSEGKNAFDDGRRGNFWEGFEAEDKNRDGILDAPYFIGPDSDRFPLASPPRS